MAYGQPYQPMYSYPTMDMYKSYAQPQNAFQNVPQTAQSAGSGIVWVQGEAGAKSYLVAAGNSVLLMDSENSVFYIKSTDPSGMPLPLRIFDYSERTQQKPQNPAPVPQFDPNQFITRQEFEQAMAKLMQNKQEVTGNAESAL